MAPPDGAVTAAAVRDLLTAISAVLDIPRPLYPGQQPVFYETQRGRAIAVATVCRDRAAGPLTDEHIRAALPVLEMHATRPLGYTPGDFR